MATMCSANTCLDNLSLYFHRQPYQLPGFRRPKNKWHQQFTRGNWLWFMSWRYLRRRCSMAIQIMNILDFLSKAIPRDPLGQSRQSPSAIETTISLCPFQRMLGYVAAIWFVENNEKVWDFWCLEGTTKLLCRIGGRKTFFFCQLAKHILMVLRKTRKIII